MRRPDSLLALVALASIAWAYGLPGPPGSSRQDPAPRASEGCIACHAGIEPMHPEADLSCTDCHGGDGKADTKEAAHVAPARTEAGDERVAPLTEDLAWRRFRNPMDLRVAMETCGGCHAGEVSRVHTSLHATTAGHLSDGFYEVGLLEKKEAKYGVFPVKADPEEPRDLESLEQVPAFNERLPREQLATHFMDLTRKECAQCHLWSNGRAVRGRVGFDGDYRGEGCAACHVEYALDGRSQSGDAQAVRNEPGHPRRHAMNRAPTTQTCTSCHNGDASIGLSFQGLSQLPPGAPGGPEIPGTTDALRHRAFYLNDPAMVPPDVHHERGMHCIDCHTENDVMGDGSLHGAMEHAVEITCQDCHGGFDAPASFATQEGTRLAQLSRDPDGVWLTSKVDGKRHRVQQVVDVLDPTHADYNERATKAMTGEHAKLECYACHASWNINFLGFHFDRNESLTQLDLLSGKRTTGRVTTQEKIFTTWKSFYAGFNEKGRVAPYLTGFSTMGTVRDKDGNLLLDQEMPVTAAGLSGMTMIHHQVHTTRGTARSCVECHRSSATWGLGSANFRLSRRLAFVAERRGVEIVAIDRAQIQTSAPLCKVVVPNVEALAVHSDPLQGHARFVYAAERDHGIHVLDVADPTSPKRVGFAASVAPHGLALAGDLLLCADGAGGLKLFDVATPSKLALVGSLPSVDARAVTVQWPHAYLADGAGGLLIVDIGDPKAPRAVGGLQLDWKDRPDQSIAVAVLFQYSRPTVFAERPADDRTRARLLCAVLDAERGLELVDVTESTAPEKLWPPRYFEEQTRRQRRRTEYQWRGMAMASHVDLAETQGGSETTERDLVYLLGERDENGNAVSRFTVIDITDPLDALPIGATDIGFGTTGLTMAKVYRPPFIAALAFVPGNRGLFSADASISAQPRSLGAMSGMNSARTVAFEEFALDRSLSEQGKPLKDVSHAKSRWLELPEIERVLRVPAARLDFPTRVQVPELPAKTARMHLTQLDRDRSGFLEGEEFTRGGGSGADLDGDQRLSLAELVALGARQEGETKAEDPPPPMRERPARTRANAEGPPSLDPDGEYACLLDTIRPREFDSDRDLRLDSAEFGRALFAALDLDGNKQVDHAELSRLPGEMRGIRFGGPTAAKLASQHDKNGDGQVSAKEWRGGAEIFAALDIDSDGALQLAQPIDAQKGQRGVTRPIEWPARQRIVNSLPPVVTRETILAAFDTDKDGVLTAKELKSRPDLVAEGDDTGDGRLELMELKADLDRIDNEGVNVTLDGFLERWDLDRDGKVSRQELPVWVRD